MSRRRCKRRRRPSPLRADRRTACSSAPPTAIRAAAAATSAGRAKPFGVATRTCAPSISPAWTSEVATLLPSPTKASVRPATEPQRSRSVCMSASAWQGCSSSDSALTTRRPGADSVKIVSRPWAKVRITTASTQRSRLRATSCSGSRSACMTSDGMSTTSPPSSPMPMVKVTRVRSDGFSNSRPTCRPASAVACGTGVRAPRGWPAATRPARGSGARSSGVKSRIDRKCRVGHG